MNPQYLHKFTRPALVADPVPQSCSLVGSRLLLGQRSQQRCEAHRHRRTCLMCLQRLTFRRLSQSDPMASASPASNLLRRYQVQDKTVFKAPPRARRCHARRNKNLYLPPYLDVDPVSRISVRVSLVEDRRPTQTLTLIPCHRQQRHRRPRLDSVTTDQVRDRVPPRRPAHRHSAPKV